MRKITTLSKKIENLAAPGEIIENAPFGIGISRNNKIIYANSFLHKIFGFKNLKTFENKNVMDFVHPEDIEKIKDILKAKKKKEQIYPYRIEHRIINANNEVKHLSIAVSEIIMENEKYSIGAFMDITESKETQAKLQKIELQYKMLFENANEGIGIYQNNQIVELNKKAAEISGYNKAQLNTMNPDKLVHADDFPHFKEWWKKLGKVQHHGEERTLRIFHRSGKLLWVKVKIQKLEWLEKQAVLFFAEDITDKKHLSDQLERNEQNYKLLITNLPGISVFLFDTNMRYIYAGGKVIESIGAKPNDYIGKTLDELFDVKILNFLKPMYEATLNGKKRSGQYNYLERWYMIRTIPLKDKNKSVYGGIAFVQDITDAKFSNEKLRKSEAEVRSFAKQLQDRIEEERNQIAMEIHDELGQNLTALKLDLSNIQRNLTKDRTLVTSKIENLIELSDYIIQKVRQISTNLRPKIIDDLGIIPSLEWLVNELNSRTNIDIRLFCIPVHFEVNKELSIHIFRICQEALTNLVRHSSATKAKVQIMDSPKTLIIRISDNGKGIDFEKMNKAGNLGIFSMKERAKLLNGKFRINQPKEGGMEIEVMIPKEKKRISKTD